MVRHRPPQFPYFSQRSCRLRGFTPFSTRRILGRPKSSFQLVSPELVGLKSLLENVGFDDVKVFSVVRDSRDSGLPQKFGRTADEHRGLHRLDCF
jgi:hypothetical protein